MLYILDTGCISKKVHNFTSNEKIVFGDDNGHGTMCNYVSNIICGHVNIINYKILNSEKEGTTLQLVESLKHIYKSYQNGIINLSLSTPANYHRKELEEIFNMLIEKGFIIVSSARNDHKLEYLSEINGSIVIDAYDLGEFEKFYLSNNENVIIGNRRPILVKNHKNEYTFFGGNSKATAIFSSYLYKYFIDIKSKNITNQYYEILNLINKSFINNGLILDISDNSNIKKNILCILNREFQMDEDAYNNKTPIFYKSNINEFVIKLENFFGVSFENRLAYINNFDTVDNLSELIFHCLL